MHAHSFEMRVRIPVQIKFSVHVGCCINAMIQKRDQVHEDVLDYVRQSAKNRSVRVALSFGAYPLRQRFINIFLLRSLLPTI